MNTTYADQRIAQDMWTTARNEPLTMKDLLPFGFVDRDKYRRQVGDVILEFTLDADPVTKAWSYELAILPRDYGTLETSTVEYWLDAFFGREASRASRRNFMMTDEARFTFPYSFRSTPPS